MSKPKSDGLSRRAFLGSSLGAVMVASIGCDSDDGAEPSTELGSGGNGGASDGTGSASGGTDSTTATESTGGASGAGGSEPVTGGAAAGGTGASTAGQAAASTGGTEAQGGALSFPDAGMDPDSGTSEVHLAAACGTFCGACPSYIAKHSEDEQVKRPNPWGDCDGCLGGGLLAAHCRTCNIRLCALDKPNVTRCCDCEELPCYRVTNLIRSGGYPHRKEYLPNLEKIRKLGAEKWVKDEEERWRCPKCRLPMSWYETACARCGEPRSESLFPVTMDTPKPY